VETTADKQRVFDALTNLTACLLGLEAERYRLDDRLRELAAVESPAGDRQALLRERDELAGEEQALRRLVDALREQVLVGANERPLI
jgi:hypothetical protein